MGRGGVMGVMEKKEGERGVVVVSLPRGEKVKVKVANLVSCCIPPSDSW